MAQRVDPWTSMLGQSIKTMRPPRRQVSQERVPRSALETARELPFLTSILGMFVGLAFLASGGGPSAAVLMVVTVAVIAGAILIHLR